jgi:hypothetical protein
MAPAKVFIENAQSRSPGSIMCVLLIRCSPSYTAFAARRRMHGNPLPLRGRAEIVGHPTLANELCSVCADRHPVRHRRGAYDSCARTLVVALKPAFRRSNVRGLARRVRRACRKDTGLPVFLSRFSAGGLVE